MAETLIWCYLLWLDAICLRQHRDDMKWYEYLIIGTKIQIIIVVNIIAVFLKLAESAYKVLIHKSK